MVTAEDLDAIASQLGKRPRNVLDVAVRCGDGHPCVITTYPLRKTARGWSPFPTFYWLTCPKLSHAVACIEREGMIASVQAEVARDPAFGEAISRDHDRYIAARWAAITHDDRDAIRAKGLVHEFNARGIGGIVDRATVKCLHLHVAHFLADGNAIGERVCKRHSLACCAAPRTP